MKGYAFAVLLTIFATALAAQKYTNRFDHVDVDAILRNNRLLSNYIKCVMDEGKCTNDGMELKSKFFSLISLFFLYLPFKWELNIAKLIKIKWKIDGILFW